MTAGAPAAPLRAVVADDEPLARDVLRVLLGAHGDVRIVAEARTGAETARALAAHRPDVVFLDITMPGGSGFDALDASGPPPAVVFVTAFAEFAARAFDLPAVDYLVKPFDRARLDRALARVRRHLGRSDTAAHPERLAVRAGSRVVLVQVADVEAVEAADDYVTLHAGGRAWLHAARLHAVEHDLAPLLVPVHRRWLVAPAHVVGGSVQRNGDGRLALASGRVVPASRTFRASWRPLLGRTPE